MKVETMVNKRAVSARREAIHELIDKIPDEMLALELDEAKQATRPFISFSSARATSAIFVPGCEHNLLKMTPLEGARAESITLEIRCGLGTLDEPQS